MPSSVKEQEGYQLSLTKKIDGLLEVEVVVLVYSLISKVPPSNGLLC